MHSGYNAVHVRIGDGIWVTFNDEKVMKADEESERAEKAYLYVFEKCRSSKQKHVLKPRCTFVQKDFAVLRRRVQIDHDDLKL